MKNVCLIIVLYVQIISIEITTQIALSPVKKANIIIITCIIVKIATILLAKVAFLVQARAVIIVHRTSL